MSRRAGMLLAGWALLAPSGAGAAVQVEAHLTRSRIALGEATALDVTVSGSMGGLQQPQLGLPPEVAVLGTSRSETVQFVNGRLSRQVTFRYELGASAPGRFTVGPVEVQVGREHFVSGSLVLEVEESRARAPAAGGRPVATLESEARPARAWVGQEILLVVRLLQRTTFAQEPDYAPPATPGFWTDRASPPESYYAEVAGGRALVTETRQRLYPLAAGTLTIGPASAVVVVRSGPGGQMDLDPFGLLTMRMAGRPIELASESLRVRVAALPRPAPQGFVGAVGSFEATWRCDRSGAAMDVPLTVTLELRGSGNIPLVRPPSWAPPDCEIYSAQSEDSLGRPGTHEPGRKRFVWTLLPRRTGRLLLEPPALAWFDPGEGRYRSARLPPIQLQVTPPLLAAAAPAERYPGAFLARPAAPGARGPWPWAWALAGLLLGATVRLAGRAAAPDPTAADRARLAEWTRTIKGPARGPEWWRCAEEAADWLGAQGGLVHHLRQQVQAARYSGQRGQEAEVRARLLERLAYAGPPASSRASRAIVAAAVGTTALVLAIGLGPRGAEPHLAARVRQAEDWARRGEWERARRAWTELWSQSPDAAVAARLAWSWAQAGDAARATIWALRGLDVAPRDPSLRWVIQRTRETGGLVGEVGWTAWPTELEAGAAALLSLAAAGLAWPRRGRAAAWALLGLAAAIGPAAGRSVRRAERRVVVLRETSLRPAGGDALLLEPGQVLVVRREASGGLEVRAGRGVEGVVPRDAVAFARGPGGG